MNNLIKTIGHGFAIAWHDVSTFFKGVATKAPAIAVTLGTDISLIAPYANALFGGVAPELLPAARGVEAIVGEVLGAIHTAGSEATQTGVVVNIGADLVAGVKDLVALLENHPAVLAAQANQTTAAK